MLPKMNVEIANEYLEWMQNIAIEYINNPKMFYYGRKGHLRMAREIGYAINSCDKEGGDIIISKSYDKIYIVGCLKNNIMPIISEQEWLLEIRYILRTRTACDE